MNSSTCGECFYLKTVWPYVYENKGPVSMAIRESEYSWGGEGREKVPLIILIAMLCAACVLCRSKPITRVSFSPLNSFVSDVEPNSMWRSAIE